MAGSKKGGDALGAMTLPSLEQHRRLLCERVEKIKAGIAEADDEIARRLMPSALAAYEQAGKDDGTLRLPLQDGLEAKVEIKKTVSWDNAELMKLAQTMPWARASALFDIKFSMKETTYKGVVAADPKLAAEVDKARTVKRSAPIIKLQKEGE